MKSRKEPKYRYSRVMLLDDSELDNFINQKIIESCCFSKKIFINTSGKSALEFLKNINTLDEEFARSVIPEVIFVDLNMPIMDGFQFLKILKNIECVRCNNLKLVVLTSSIHPEDYQKVNEIDANILYLKKPLTEEELNKL